MNAHEAQGTIHSQLTPTETEDTYKHCGLKTPWGKPVLLAHEYLSIWPSEASMCLFISTPFFSWAISGQVITYWLNYNKAAIREIKQNLKVIKKTGNNSNGNFFLHVLHHRCSGETSKHGEK